MLLFQVDNSYKHVSFFSLFLSFSYALPKPLKLLTHSGENCLSQRIFSIVREFVFYLYFYSYFSFVLPLVVVFFAVPFNFCTDFDVAAVKQGLNSPQLLRLGGNLLWLQFVLPTLSVCISVGVCVCVWGFWVFGACSERLLRVHSNCACWPQHGLRVAAGVEI